MHFDVEIFKLILRNGLADVIGLDWLRMFSSRELSILISGSEQEIGIDDLMVRSVHCPILETSIQSNPESTS